MTKYIKLYRFYHIQNTTFTTYKTLHTYLFTSLLFCHFRQTTLYSIDLPHSFLTLNWRFILYNILRKENLLNPLYSKLIFNTLNQKTNKVWNISPPQSLLVWRTYQRNPRRVSKKRLIVWFTNFSGGLSFPNSALW